MGRQLGSAIAVALALTSTLFGGVIDVTVKVTELDGITPVSQVGSTYQITIGVPYLFSAFGQVVPARANAGNGIFGWDVDLRIADPGVATVNAATVNRSGWTNGLFPLSSSGTPMPWGIDAIYDTQETTQDAGLSSPGRLFAVQFSGTTAGTTTLAIEPDYTTGPDGDFVTWLGETGGNYSLASARVNAVPEPSTLCLVTIAGGALLVARRLRRKR